MDPIMLNLYELIRTATEVIDMSVAQLTAEEHICDAIVARIQKIGKAWDDNPDWHGRSWYVQVLLAVASLSRVVEWWTAEKHFWNFDDDDDVDDVDDDGGNNDDGDDLNDSDSDRFDDAQVASVIARGGSTRNWRLNLGVTSVVAAPSLVQCRQLSRCSTA